MVIVRKTLVQHDSVIALHQNRNPLEQVAALALLSGK